MVRHTVCLGSQR